MSLKSCPVKVTGYSLSFRETDARHRLSCNSRLMPEASVQFEEVRKNFTTAKFFRFFTVVLFLGTFIWLAYESGQFRSVWIITFCIISFYVFLNRWCTANHVAFQNLIVLNERNSKNRSTKKGEKQKGLHLINPYKKNVFSSLIPSQGPKIPLANY